MNHRINSYMHTSAYICAVHCYAISANVQLLLNQNLNTMDNVLHIYMCVSVCARQTSWCMETLQVRSPSHTLRASISFTSCRCSLCSWACVCVCVSVSYFQSLYSPMPIYMLTACYLLSYFQMPCFSRSRSVPLPWGRFALSTISLIAFYPLFMSLFEWAATEH